MTDPYANIDAALPVIKETAKHYDLTITEACACIQASNTLAQGERMDDLFTQLKSIKTAIQSIEMHTDVHVEQDDFKQCR
jgi:hypothetical protein